MVLESGSFGTLPDVGEGRDCTACAEAPSPPACLAGRCATAGVANAGGKYMEHLQPSPSDVLPRTGLEELLKHALSPVL